MKDSKTQTNKSNPLVVAAAGMAVGAGLAIAGALTLKDKKNHQKVTDAVESAKSMVSETADALHDQAEVSKAVLAQKIGETKRGATKMVRTFKGSLYHDVDMSKVASKNK